MDNFFLEWALSTIFSFLKYSIKNEESKARWKRAFLKLRNQIDIAYGGDNDFSPTFPMEGPKKEL